MNKTIIELREEAIKEDKNPEFYLYQKLEEKEKENKRLNKENMELHIKLEDRAYEQIKFQWKDYKSRNEKAIEYTKQFINGKTSRIDEWKNVELVLETIVQLLQGEDKE